jgi:hypothetical protein
MNIPLITTAVFVLALSATPPDCFAYIGPEELERGVKECSGQGLNTFRCARGIEEKVLSGSTSSVRRVGSTLIIPTEKVTVRLVDNPSENGNESIAYSYLGRIESIGSHVIYVQYYEGGTYMVVNERSGQGAFPSGFPIVSPDRKHFLSISEDMFAGYYPNNVEVWRVSATASRRVANFEPEWGPSSARWLLSGKIEVNKVCYPSPEGGNAELQPCGKAHVVRTNAGWKLIK